MINAAASTLPWLSKSKIIASQCSVKTTYINIHCNIHCTVYSYFSNKIIYICYRNVDLYNKDLRPQILRPLNLLVSPLKLLVTELHLMTGVFEDQSACPYFNAIHATLQSNLKLFHVTKSYREHGKSSRLSLRS